MFQNKKLKRNATSAIAEVAEVALCPPLTRCYQWLATAAIFSSKKKLRCLQTQCRKDCLRKLITRIGVIQQA